jgi:hypothetical protein
MKMSKKRLVKKADLRDISKADLIKVMLANVLINEATKKPYSRKDLEAVTYNELVNTIVNSKKFYVVES